MILMTRLLTEEQVKRRRDRATARSLSEYVVGKRITVESPPLLNQKHLCFIWERMVAEHTDRAVYYDQPSPGVGGFIEFMTRESVFPMGVFLDNDPDPVGLVWLTNRLPTSAKVHMVALSKIWGYKAAVISCAVTDWLTTIVPTLIGETPDTAMHRPVIDMMQRIGFKVIGSIPMASWIWDDDGGYPADVVISYKKRS
jgi:hypothetical protein